MYAFWLSTINSCLLVTRSRTSCQIRMSLQVDVTRYLISSAPLTVDKVNVIHLGFELQIRLLNVFNVREFAQTGNQDEIIFRHCKHILQILITSVFSNFSSVKCFKSSQPLQEIISIFNAPAIFLSSQIVWFSGKVVHRLS